MKLIIKAFVFLCVLIIVYTTNLKLYKNLDSKNTYFTDFEEDRSKLLLHKFFSIQKNTNLTFEISDLLQDIGDKTFICVILLYFNSSAIYLFLTSFVLKMIHLHIKDYLYESFISEIFLFKVIFPIKIFQFLGVIFYQLCGYSIIFKIIFSNTDTTYKKTETEDLKHNFNFHEKLKLIFIILFSFFSSFNTNIPNDRDLLPFTINKFFINFVNVLLSIGIAILIGHGIYKKFSKEFSMVISSITFLLLSIDGAVKIFAY